MKIREIIELALNKKIDYAQAVSKLSELKLDAEEHESYERILYKILGDGKKLDHTPKYLYPGIPNEFYFPILMDTIKMIREGWFSPDICQHLYETYGIASSLITFFVNEAISIVRMNTLQPAEIAAIGQAYHKIAKSLEESHVDQKPEIDTGEEINAEPVSDVMTDEDEPFYN
jgi:hypothetical protein